MENNSRIKNIRVNLPVFKKELGYDLKKEQISYGKIMFYTTILPTAKNKEIKETTREAYLEVKDQRKTFKKDQMQYTKNKNEKEILNAKTKYDEHVSSYMSRTRAHINHVQEIKARKR